MELALIDPISVDKVNSFFTNWTKWYVSITKEVINPFNYVRQYQAPFQEIGGLQSAKTAFFVPHKNETGYWWQGKNARLASMTSAFLLAQRQIKKNYNYNSDSISNLATAQLDWISGKNPYGLCMLDGYGVANYPPYVGRTNFLGGICNGITSDDLTETYLSSMTFDNRGFDAWQNWRWVEQWLPHNAWWLMSVSVISNNLNYTYTDCQGVVGGEAIKDECGVCAGGTTGVAPVLSKSACDINSLEMEENIGSSTVQLFPNPGNEAVIVNFHSAEIGQVKVLDMNGATIYQESNFKNEQKINTTRFLPGMYSVSISYDNKIKKAKFAVVR